MSNNKKTESKLHSLIALEDFKALMGIDDREDRIARFCLVTATHSIEQYCKRRLVQKKHTDYHTFSGDYIFTLREYPVIKMSNEQIETSNGEMIGQEFYRFLPDLGTYEDIPYSLILSPAVKLRNGSLIKVVYRAGYPAGRVPADLTSACLELAAWNMNRYRGRRIGMTGSVRKEGEHFELFMPLQVRQLLEPYKRKTI